MSPRRQQPKPDLVKRTKELGNTSRNERQKSLLLCEVGKLQRQQMGEIVETSREIVEKSKKLCEKAAPRAPSRRSGTG